ncbi:MAG TPA: hypothetical protein VHN20_16620 [Beijerinckiaceae bacterium]|nr:hypothetical protein [Beijerinckiaceae bacterium]
MRLTRNPLATGLTAALVAVAAVASAVLFRGFLEPAASRAIRPIWTEAHWPFAVDPWGKGKAFRCRTQDCGGEVHVYVRAKLGFCNCTTGIADDAELDRMGDLDLIGRRTTPAGPGRLITVGPMQGRSRIYRPAGARSSNEAVISTAFNERCDMIAATALLDHPQPETMEAVLVEFLNSEAMLKWTEATLGL